MESFYYFINIFYTFAYAFVLDNFRFFEPANEKIHSQIHDFIHRIYDDSKSNLEALEAD